MRRRLTNILAVAYRETVVLRHDKGFLAAAAAQPVMITLLMGACLSYRPHDVPWVVVDRSQSVASRRLVAEFGTNAWFADATQASGYADAIARMRRDEARAALIIPHAFAADVLRGRARVEFLVDGSDPITASRLASAAGRIAGAVHLRRDDLDREAPPPITVRRRFWFNATLADGPFFLAALAGMLLTNVCFSVTALGIVGERESGTYEQTLSLPTSGLEIVLGKLLPLVVTCYAMLAFGLLLSGTVFGVWPEGSWFALAVVTLPFVLASLAIGVLVSTLAHTSAQAVFVTVFFVMPSFVLGGIMFPYGLMPPAVRWIGALLPLRWYSIALRRIVARGAGLVDVLGPIAMLVLLFGVLLVLIKRRMPARLG